MFCQGCGKKIEIYDNYCKSCGKNLNNKSKLKTLSYLFFLFGLSLCFTISPLAFIFGVMGLIFSLISNKYLRNIYSVFLNSLLILLSVFMFLIQCYVIDCYRNNYLNLKKIGNDYLGYIKIPCDLNRKSNSLENKIEYYDGEGNSVILYLIEDSMITVNDYSNNIINKYKDIYTDISIKKYYYNNYYVVYIYSYDEINDIYINDWIFKEKNGNLHHITINSLKENDSFKLIKTYNLKG